MILELENELRDCGVDSYAIESYFNFIDLLNDSTEIAIESSKSTVCNTHEKESWLLKIKKFFLTIIHSIGTFFSNIGLHYRIYKSCADAIKEQITKISTTIGFKIVNCAAKDKMLPPSFHNDFKNLEEVAHYEVKNAKANSSNDQKIVAGFIAVLPNVQAIKLKNTLEKIVHEMESNTETVINNMYQQNKFYGELIHACHLYTTQIINLGLRLIKQSQYIDVSHK